MYIVMMYHLPKNDLNITRTSPSGGLILYNEYIIVSLVLPSVYLLKFIYKQRISTYTISFQLLKTVF